MIKASEEDIGRHVIYIPFKGCDQSQYEYGRITSINNAFVFVDYGYSCGRGIATIANDLIFQDNF